MMAVVAERRDIAAKCGKIFCRPKMAFLRENLVGRGGRQSSQSWVPNSECTRRAPTSEECRRSCPVPRAAEPDNRESPAPGMEVVYW